MAVKLREVTREGRTLVATYTVSQDNGKTTLEHDMNWQVCDGEITAAMSISTGACQWTPAQVIEKLADNLERMSRALRDRGESTDLVPVFEPSPLSPKRSDTTER